MKTSTKLTHRLSLAAVTIVSLTLLPLLRADSPPLKERAKTYADELRTAAAAAGVSLTDPAALKGFALGKMAGGVDPKGSYGLQVLALLAGSPAPAGVLAKDASAFVKKVQAEAKKQELDPADPDKWRALTLKLLKEEENTDEEFQQQVLMALVCPAEEAKAKAQLKEEGVVAGSELWKKELLKLLPTNCPPTEIVAKQENPVPKFESGKTNDFPRTFFHIGLAAVTPYKMKSDGSIDSSSLDTRTFLEFIFNHRWAWQYDDNSLADLKADEWNVELGWPFVASQGSTFNGRAQEKRDSAHPGEWFRKGWDFQTRFSYAFGNGSDTLPDAAALGGSEFQVEGTLGRNLVRYVTADHSMRISFGPELSAGLATDRRNFEVHPHGLVGVGWTIGGKSPFATDPHHRYALSLRTGYAWQDVPSLTTGTNGLALKLDPTIKLVEYDGLKGGLGVETELFYPLSETAFLTLGGRAYSLSGKDQWSFYIGYVKSIDKLLSGLFP